MSRLLLVRVYPKELDRATWFKKYGLLICKKPSIHFGNHIGHEFNESTDRSYNGCLYVTDCARHQLMTNYHRINYVERPAIIYFAQFGIMYRIIDVLYLFIELGMAKVEHVPGKILLHFNGPITNQDINRVLFCSI